MCCPITADVARRSWFGFFFIFWRREFVIQQENPPKKYFIWRSLFLTFSSLFCDRQIGKQNTVYHRSVSKHLWNDDTLGNKPANHSQTRPSNTGELQQESLRVLILHVRYFKAFVVAFVDLSTEDQGYSFKKMFVVFLIEVSAAYNRQPSINTHLRCSRRQVIGNHILITQMKTYINQDGLTPDVGIPILPLSFPSYWWHWHWTVSRPGRRLCRSSTRKLQIR